MIKSIKEGYLIVYLSCNGKENIHQFQFLLKLTFFTSVVSDIVI